MPGILVAIGDHSEGHCDQQGESGGGDGQQEGVLQAAEVERIPEQFSEVGERQPPIRVNEAAFQNLQNRPEKKHGQ